MTKFNWSNFIDSHVFGYLMYYCFLSYMSLNEEIFVCAYFKKGGFTVWFNGGFLYD